MTFHHQVENAYHLQPIKQRWQGFGQNPDKNQIIILINHWGKSLIIVVLALS
jgi:hypothetical protein